MKLTFVYNAKSGKLNALFDSAHKVLSPSTYACDLCALTHGFLGEKATWRRFREESGLEFDFLHSDEVAPNLIEGLELPVILHGSDTHEVAVSAQQLAAFQSTKELIEFLERYAE